MSEYEDYYEQAVENAKVDEMLGNIDIGYIRESIYTQIDNAYETTAKTNFLKYLNKQLDKRDDLDPDYKRSIMDNLYQNIIQAISEKFKFNIDDTEVARSVMAENLYKFFILQYPKNLVYFIEMVIIEERHSIGKELDTMDDINRKKVSGLNTETSLIYNNMAQVISIIKGMNYSFDEYIDYISKHEDSKAAVEEVKKYVNQYMDDTDSIVPGYMTNLTDENEGFSDIYMELQERLRDRFARD